MANKFNISFFATRFCVGVMGILCVFTIVPLVCYTYMAHTLDIKPIFRKILDVDYVHMVQNDIDRLKPKSKLPHLFDAYATKSQVANVDTLQKHFDISLQATENPIVKKKDFYAEFFEKNQVYRKRMLYSGNFYEDIIGWNLQIGVNGVIKLSDTHLGIFDKKYDMQPSIKKICEFRDWLKKRNIPLFFVSVPKKVDLNSPYTYLYDYSIRNTEELLSGLREHDVPVLDLFEPMKNLGGEFMDLYYKTDHHWKPETGLWATKEIAKWLAKQTDIQIDTNLFAPEKYNYRITKNGYLGRLGNKLTTARCSPDDFVFVTPKFSIKVHAKIAGFMDSVGNNTMLFYSDSTDYNIAYRPGNHDAKIENLQMLNNYKIFMFGDSFTNVVEPFLAFGVKNFHTIDPRKKISACSFFEKNSSYNVVILLFYAGDDYGILREAILM